MQAHKILRRLLPKNADSLQGKACLKLPEKLVAMSTIGLRHHLINSVKMGHLQNPCIQIPAIP